MHWISSILFSTSSLMTSSFRRATFNFFGMVTLLVFTFSFTKKLHLCTNKMIVNPTFSSLYNADTAHITTITPTSKNIIICHCFEPGSIHIVLGLSFCWNMVFIVYKSNFWHICSVNKPLLFHFSTTFSNYVPYLVIFANSSIEIWKLYQHPVNMLLLFWDKIWDLQNSCLEFRYSLR